ncbi:MAG: hypothetical protein ABL890_04260 [Candidatus Peribacteraceae bacterium]
MKRSTASFVLAALLLAEAHAGILPGITLPFAASTEAAGESCQYNYSGTNLIQNGSFEDPTVTASEGFQIVNSLPGWTLPQSWLELQRDGLNLGDNASASTPHGNQWAELDVVNVNQLVQDVSTTPSRGIRIAVEWSPRPGTGHQSVEVHWNGQVVGTLSGNGNGKTRDEWKTATFFADTGNRSEGRLLFRTTSAGAEGRGMLIDHVRVQQSTNGCDTPPPTCQYNYNGTNLIQNGSFEDPVVTAATKFQIVNSLPGWTLPTSWLELERDGIDLGDGASASTPSGSQWAEIDVVNTNQLYQDVALIQGRGVKIMVEWSPRPGTGHQSVDVYWNNQVIGTLEGSGDGQNRDQWRTATFYAENDDRTTGRLHFRATAADPVGRGIFIDNVRVNQSTNSCFACADNVDNDGDGAKDFPTDFSCSGPLDNDEENPKSACQDGADNDGDGLTDGNDPGCENPQDNDESPVNTATIEIIDTVQDGTVTTGDTAVFVLNLKNTGSVDAPTALRVHNTFKNAQGQVLTTSPFTFVSNTNGAVASCAPHSAQYPHNIVCQLTSPLTAGLQRTFGLRYDTNAAQFCGQTITHTAEVIVFVNQAHQTVATDTETITVQCATPPQCSDNADNDGDGAIDSADFSCSGDNDNDETNPKSKCQDGADNDGDGLIDFGTGPNNDPGCSSLQDNDETNAATPQCSDGQDNDGDGAADAADASCHSDLNVNNSASYQPNKNNEETPKTACQDGADNDQDGLTDGNDPGCIGPQDNDESPVNTATFTITDTANKTTVALNEFVSFIQNVKNTGTVDANSTLRIHNIFLDAQGNVIQNPSLTLDGNTNETVATCAPHPNASYRIVCTLTSPLTAGLQRTFGVRYKATSTALCGQTITHKAEVRITPPNSDQQVVATDTATITVQCVPPPPQCSDGQDNDGDNLIDFGTGPNNDPGCSSLQDNDETNAATPQCSDGIDNDGDGAIDSADFSCSGDNDNDETNPKSKCQDGVDNDGDNLIDFGAGPNNDPGCSSLQDNDETNQVSLNFTGTKSANLHSILVGQSIMYTLTVTNNGNQTVNGIRIVDIIPAGLTYIPAGSTAGCVLNSGTRVDCPAFTYTPGQTRSFTLKFKLENAVCGNGARLDNFGDIQSNNTSFAWTNHVYTPVDCAQAPQCSDGDDNDGDGLIDFGNSATNDPGCSSPEDNDETNPETLNFSAVKTADKTTAQRGDLITYTIQVKNLAATPATEIRIRDNVPADTTYVSANDPGCFLKDNGTDPEAIFCPFENYAAGQMRTYMLTFKVNQNAPCSSIIENKAVVQKKVGTGPHHSFGSSNPTYTTVQCSTTPQCSDGQDNDGDGSTDFAGGDFSCSGPDDNDETYPQSECQDGFDNDGDGLIDFGYNISNDPGCSDNQDNDESHATNNTADVSIVKAGASQITRGGTIAYTISVHNLGPNTAKGVTVTDPVPAGLVFNPQFSDPSCVQNGVNILCEGITLAANTSKTLTIAFTVPVINNCTQTAVQNTATVSSSTKDPNSANNTSQTVSTIVKCPSSTLSLTKTDGRTQAAPGETLTYTIAIQNTSDIDATNITLTDVIPLHVAYVSASDGGQLIGPEVQWQNLTIPAHAIVTRTLTVRVVSTALNGSVIANTAAVGNITATDTTTVVTAEQKADLVIRKTSNAQSVVRGQNVLYTIQVTNLGPANATNVIVTDNIPDNLNYVSASGASCVLALPLGGSNGFLACELDTISAGASKYITLTFSTSAPQQQCSDIVVYNSASVLTSVSDPDLTNNTSTAVTTLTCPVLDKADLTVQKTATASTVMRGQLITYTVRVGNNGPATAENVKVRDSFPLDLEYVSSSGSGCTVTGGYVECSLGNMGPQDVQKVVQFMFRAKSLSTCTQSQLMTNTATVSTVTAESNTANNTSAVQTTVTCQTTNTDTDLSVIKTGPASVTYGQNVTYTVTVQNNGTNAATNVVVTDTYPSQMTYLASSSSSQCTAEANNTVRCSLASLAAAQQTAFTLVFQVGAAPATCTQTSISNSVTVSATNSDPSQGNNSSTATSTLTCQNGTLDQLSIYKSDGRSTAYTQERLRYMITVNNNQSTTVTNVSVTDNVPSGLSIISVSDSGQISGQTVTWNNLTLAGYQSRTFYIDAEIQDSVADGTVITNTATVGTKQATDATTIKKIPTYTPPTYNPPNYPPVYYPPVGQPPVYYPPVGGQPPVYYPPVNHPPIYSQPKPGYTPPIYVYPETGGEVSFYANASETDELTALADAATDTAPFSTAFYLTLLTMMATGSAAASRFLMGGGMMLG